MADADAVDDDAASLYGLATWLKRRTKKRCCCELPPSHIQSIKVLGVLMLLMILLLENHKLDTHETTKLL